MVNTELSKKINTAVNNDSTKTSSGHSILSGLSIWENFDPSNKQRFESQLRIESMTIFVITKGEGTIKLNMENVHVKENCMIHISPNTILDPPTETRVFTI